MIVISSFFKLYISTKYTKQYSYNNQAAKCTVLIQLKNQLSSKYLPRNG